MKVKLANARSKVDEDLGHLQDALDQLDQRDMMRTLEQEFAECVVDFSDRRGISYRAWRTLGVSPQLLRKAGVKQKPAI